MKSADRGKGGHYCLARGEKLNGLCLSFFPMGVTGFLFSTLKFPPGVVFLFLVGFSNSDIFVRALSLAAKKCFKNQDTLYVNKYTRPVF